MSRKMAISLFFGCGLSALMLYLAFRNVPFGELLTYLQTINYWWLLPTTIIVVLTFVLRALRWQIIVRNAGRLSFWQAFHPLMIGFMMNCTLPGRVGEIARPVLLKKERKISLTTGLATVAAERLFDILLLMLLFMAVFSKISSQPGVQVAFGAHTLDNQTLHTIAWGLIRLSLLLLSLMLLLAFPWTRKRIIDILGGLTRTKVLAGPGKIRKYLLKTVRLIIDGIENISAGFGLVRYPGRLAACLLLSGAIWGLTIATYMVLAKGFPGVHLSAWDWTTVMVVVCFFIALPSAPGFWGLWEAGGVFALSMFGIEAKEAAGITLVNHVVQMFPVIFIGFFSAAMTSVNILRVVDKKNHLATAS